MYTGVSITIRLYICTSSCLMILARAGNRMYERTYIRDTAHRLQLLRGVLDIFCIKLTISHAAMGYFSAPLLTRNVSLIDAFNELGSNTIALDFYLCRITIAKKM